MLIGQNRWVAGKKISEGSMFGLVTALGGKNRPQPMESGIACEEVTVDICVFLCKGNGV